MVGLRPMMELKGQRMQSLNYINAQNAGKYQVGEENKEQDKEPDKENKEPKEKEKDDNRKDE